MGILEIMSSIFCVSVMLCRVCNSYLYVIISISRLRFGLVVNYLLDTVEPWFGFGFIRFCFGDALMFLGDFMCYLLLALSGYFRFTFIFITPLNLCLLLRWGKLLGFWIRLIVVHISLLVCDFRFYYTLADFIIVIIFVNLCDRFDKIQAIKFLTFGVLVGAFSDFRHADTGNPVQI